MHWLACAMCFPFSSSEKRNSRYHRGELSGGAPCVSNGYNSARICMAHGAWTDGLSYPGSPRALGSIKASRLTAGCGLPNVVFSPKIFLLCLSRSLTAAHSPDLF